MKFQSSANFKANKSKSTIHMSLLFTEKPLTILEFEDEVPGRELKTEDAGEA